MGSHTTYLGMVYETDIFRKRIKETVKMIKEFRKENAFDAIAFTGCSGAAFSYPLSYLLNVPLICVRKLKDDCHFDRSTKGNVEGFTQSEKYLIVDDFSCSGQTMRTIVKEVNEFYTKRLKKEKPKLVGVAFYNADNAGYITVNKSDDYQFSYLWDLL